MADSRRPGIATLAAAGYVAGLLVLSVVHLVAPQRNGPLALTQIFAPHSFLGLLLIVPVALLARDRRLIVATFAVVVVGATRFGPGLVSMPGGPGSDELTVMSWNLEAGAPSPREVVAVIAETDASFVALQELTPATVTAIETDPTLRSRFPHRVLRPLAGVLGMGVLSTWPIAQITEGRQPPFIEVEVARASGEGSLTLLNVHPLPAALGSVTGLRIPLVFDATRRDRELAALRGRLDGAIGAGHAVVLVGDLNVTDQEPAYGDVSRGLRDVHLHAGLGPGWTWRPRPLDAFAFGVLRIDYVFVGPGIRPIRTWTDCTVRGSDHCILVGIIEPEGL